MVAQSSMCLPLLSTSKACCSQVTIDVCGENEVIEVGTYIQWGTKRRGRVGAIEKNKTFVFEVMEMASVDELPEYGITYVPPDRAYNGRQVRALTVAVTALL
jgi:hypothetical protein